MTEYGILPDMDALLRESAFNRGSSYQQQCMLLNQQLGYGLPVYHPLYISLDNATIHPHARKRLLQQRVPTPEMQAVFRQKVVPLVRSLSDQVTQLVRDQITLHWNYDLSASWGRFPLQPWTSAVAQLDNMVQFYVNLCLKCPDLPRDAYMFQHISVLHHPQYMPLGPKMPDAHCPVEHAVGTLKQAVMKKLRACDLHDPKLFKAATTQQWLEEAAQEHFAGVRGQNHIKGSIEKQQFLVKVLAADEDQTVTHTYVPHKYSNRGAPKTSAVTIQMQGTAGKWASPKWS